MKQVTNYEEELKSSYLEMWNSSELNALQNPYFKGDEMNANAKDMHFIKTVYKLKKKND